MKYQIMLSGTDNGDNLHEMSNPVFFGEKCFSMLTAENLPMACALNN